MIPKQKIFTIIIFIFSFVLLLSGNIPNVHAANIRSFSINNEGKYFIYYRDGLDPSTVEEFRNEVIKLIPHIEKWAGFSFDKLEVDIVPDSFDDYVSAYGGTDPWKLHQQFSPDKASYDGIAAEAQPIYQEFIIKESHLGAIYHEASHLAEFPFAFDHYFSEGLANNGASVISSKVGVTLDSDSQRERFNQLPAKDRKFYNVIIDATETDKNKIILSYVVGTIFIEKILQTAGVEDLSAFLVNLRGDFSDVINKYPKPDTYFSFVSTTGQEMYLSTFGVIHFNSAAGQEVIQCELIKTYGEKIAPVFTEFGFPAAVNCDSKIRNYKAEKSKEADARLLSIKNGAVEAHERTAVVATEKDQWEGDDNNATNPPAWAYAVVMLLFASPFVGVIYFFYKKRKRKAGTKPKKKLS